MNSYRPVGSGIFARAGLPGAPTTEFDFSECRCNLGDKDNTCKFLGCVKGCLKTVSSGCCFSL